MERLTYRDADGTAMMKKRGSWQGEGIARLAAYEDTGLEPDMIEATINGQTMPDIKEKLVELMELNIDYGLADILADHLIANGVTIQQDQFREVTKMVTNADRIRAMSDEKLAGFLDGVQEEECKTLLEVRQDGTLKFASLRNGWLAWLQQPAEEVDHE